MPFFDAFERKFLFVLTRCLALLFIFCLLAAIVVGGIAVSDRFLPKETTKVTPTEVMEAIKPLVYEEVSQAPAGQPSQQDPNALPGIRMPFVLQKHFNNPDNIRILRGWLEQVQNERRQEFIDELAAVAVEAEKTNTDMVETINKYKELKFAKIQEEKYAKAELGANRLQYIGAAFACITLIAMFSLIPVLLAIERNTRRANG